MSETLITEKGTVQCTVNKLNIRAGAPNTTVAVAGSSVLNDKLQYIGYVNDGQSINGISKWYKLTDGNYVWGGAVKVISVEKQEAAPVTSKTNSNTITAAVGSGCTNNKSDVRLVQELLNEKGISVGVDGLFGNNTAAAIRNFQKGGVNFSNPDGRVDPGGKTWQALNNPEVTYTKPTVSSGTSDDLNTKYKGVTFEGSVFPDKPIIRTKKINLNSSMRNKYLPALDKALVGSPRGLKLLCTVMAFHEGYREGTRSYINNNPGNIGNTDSGANVKYPTLEAGIERQRDYINGIIAGKSSAYPMGKEKIIKPYYSAEIARNPQYGLPANVPGYRFIFTGQIDQFVKIYSTGARAGNGYVSTIISYFAQNNITIKETTTLAEIVNIK
jgi:peptidoglycan hydrolase-like protein with peptidoglycan-binding domain